MDDAGEDTPCVSESRLNELDVSDWSVRDVCEWLELIGFSYLKQAFTKHQVTGQILTNDKDILKKINFNNPEDCEILQSEISALQMTDEEEGDAETVMLQALDKANVTNRANSMNKKFTTITEEKKSNSHSAPEEANSSNDFHLGELDLNMSPCQPSSCQPSSCQPSLYQQNPNTSDTISIQSETPRNDPQEHNEHGKGKKKSKKKGFFSSLRKKKLKKEESDPTAPSENAKTTTDSNPDGKVTINYFPPNGGKEMSIEFSVSSAATSREVVSLCLDHLGLNEDIKCYYIVIVCKKNKKASYTELAPTDSLLVVQQKWKVEDENRFELRNRVDGFITIEHEDLEQDEIVSYQLGISGETTASDVVSIALKVFDQKDDPKYFLLGEGDHGNQIPDNTLLLGLPLHGGKCNVFKLVNASQGRLMQRKVSCEDPKKVEDKITSLKQQINKLSTLNEEYKRNNEHLIKENSKLNKDLKTQGQETVEKTNNIKALQDQIQGLNEKLRSSADTDNDPLKTENDKLKKKIGELQNSVKTADRNAKSIKDSKISLEKEHEEMMNKCKKMELLTNDLKDQLDFLREEKSNAANKTEKMNKLYNQNMEYLKCIQNLETKLSEEERKLAEVQIRHDAESSEAVEDLRNRIDSLDSAVLAKDTRILELEFKIQQKEREVYDTAEQLHDQCRKTHKEAEIRENIERRCEDLVLQINNLRSQISEKDKHIESLKELTSKVEQRLSKQKHVMENERNQKLVEITELEGRHQNEINVLKEKIENAEKLLSETDKSLKQLTFDLKKEKDDLQHRNNILEKKISAQDVLIDRLENKIAKADVNTDTKLQEQGELLRSKDEKLRKIEDELGKLENEHSSKVREMANTIRLREDLIATLETRFNKLEKNSADNVKKFEKYVSEKEDLFQQVTAEHDQTFKELKSRTRELEEIVKEKDRKLTVANRQYGESKATADARLKKREKEYKRQKFLLEKVLLLVNDKAPSLLRQLHDSLDYENQSLDALKTSAASPRATVINDEWC